VQAYNEFYNSAFGHTLKPGDHRKAVQAALVGHGRGGGGGIKRGGAGAMGMGMQLQYNEPGKEAVEALFFSKTISHIRRRYMIVMMMVTLTFENAVKAEIIQKQSLLRHNLDSQVAEQRRNKPNHIDERQLSDFELERQRSKRDEKALYDAVSEETVTESQVPLKERDTRRHEEREMGATPTYGHPSGQFPGEFASGNGGGGGGGGG